MNLWARRRLQTSCSPAGNRSVWWFYCRRTRTAIRNAGKRWYRNCGKKDAILSWRFFIWTMRMRTHQLTAGIITITWYRNTDCCAVITKSKSIAGQWNGGIKMDRSPLRKRLRKPAETKKDAQDHFPGASFLLPGTAFKVFWDIPLWDRSDRRDHRFPRPNGRDSGLQFREFVPECLCCFILEPLYTFEDAELRIAADVQMDMIRQDIHVINLPRPVFGHLCQGFPEPVHVRGREYFPSVLRAPDNMVTAAVHDVFRRLIRHVFNL